MSSNGSSSTGSKNNTTVPGVYVEQLKHPTASPIQAQKFYMDQQDWKDILKGAEAKPPMVTLEDMKKLVKSLVPAIFSMKTRSGAVVPQLRNLLRKMQMLHNAKVLADENLETALKAIRALEEGSKDFQETVRYLGTKLPSVIEGPVTITLPEPDARYLSEMSKELVLSWGEKQLEQAQRLGNKSGDSSKQWRVVGAAYGAAIQDHGDQLRRAYASLNAFGTSMGVVPAVSAGHHAPTSFSGRQLEELHDAVVAELTRQHFYAPKIELYLDSALPVLEVRVTMLIPTRNSAVLDKAALRAVFDRRLPEGIRVESPLL